MKHRPIDRRVFLFLQGPPGPFFARLGAALAGAGHRVHRINFNGGDRFSWPGRATNYRGTAEEWPRFFEEFTTRHGVTDLVLFGDCRPLHRAAHGLATINRLSIHVFEEGYIRPDWVTLEADGVNGHSTLSRDPEWYLQAARALPPIRPQAPIAASFARRAREAYDYYQACVLERGYFPHYRSHRPNSAIGEGFGWLIRLATRKRARERSQRIIADLAGQPYFVFPLQLDSDHQIRVHSPFGNMRVAIDYVVASFSRRAPADAILVLKEHPLDNGLINWRRYALQRAAHHGVAQRVVYIEDGDIESLVSGARGLVTINSTTGTLALAAGMPTAVLGQAVYDIAGITHQGPLDTFWANPRRPDPRLWDAFCRVLLDRCLIRGGFLSDEGLDLLVENAAARLTTKRADEVVELPLRISAPAAAPQPVAS
ncbi:capsule biosynthesis protein [Sphingomonas quercus]|uniref:Capsular biosynthesis protein n=1 Tax=Sphingomonas quercus TaxID=2842451 RepID=A0ABS6BI84_9SPHN|nr:capsular biosynthesis protein [Sphingomonas quercus]MBU3077151.1 capsular biosynthesis protein [Sphingomonas quercus]